jgi:hypothetical protein
MKKSSLLAAVTTIVTLFSASIAAAQTPKFEVAGGYAYLHETDLSIPAGWFGSVGATLNDWVGIVGAVSGHYKTQTESGIDVNTKLHTFVAGPKFASYKNPNITPYVQVLFGGAHISGSAQVPGSTANVSVTKNGFDFQPGVGVDIKANRTVGIRLGINEDFIRSEGETSKEFQFIAGVVIRR